MQVQTPDEVLERIEEVARVARTRARNASGFMSGVVATDGDGTLWSGDVGEDFYFAFCEHARIEPVAEAALLREAREHAVDTNAKPAVVARRIYEAYVAGSFPEERVCELMTWCFAGWSRDDVRSFAERVVASAAVEARIHPELRRVLDGVRRAGIEIFLVSASPRAIVEAAARLVDIPIGNVIAADPLWSARADVMLADVARPIPYDAGKVHGLRSRIGGRELYAAFGDNAFDVALLAEARVPVAVRPKPKLRARAAEVPALVELARPAT